MNIYDNKLSFQEQLGQCKKIDKLPENYGKSSMFQILK
jgi:hypothetical protein